MLTSEQSYIQSLIEPDQTLPPARPFKSNWRPLVEISKPDEYSKLTEVEKDRRNDEWVEKHLNINT